MSSVLALFASLFWGTSDYLGGSASRKLGATRVMLVSQLATLPVLLIAYLVSQSWDAPLSVTGWAVGAGRVHRHRAQRVLHRPGARADGRGRTGRCLRRDRAGRGGRGIGGEAIRRCVLRNCARRPGRHCLRGSVLVADPRTAPDGPADSVRAGGGAGFRHGVRVSRAWQSGVARVDVAANAGDFGVAAVPVRPPGGAIGDAAGGVPVADRRPRLPRHIRQRVHLPLPASAGTSASSPSWPRCIPP